MISLKDLETLIDDDELLDMVIFAKCMKSDNSKLLGLKKIQYGRYELHKVLQNIQKEFVKRTKTHKCTTDFRNERGA